MSNLFEKKINRGNEGFQKQAERAIPAACFVGPRAGQPVSERRVPRLRTTALTQC